ncbi:Putative WD repeat protein [Penicillium brasilianum]|uniref:Putative WD repeat protein n=1 Tax=Penicillium brasilianum TaxID=104259 RepID=A0A0F7TKK7_PENBI|nr:Putative WD repeat protein [Penicillium brasilianum]
MSNPVQSFDSHRRSTVFGRQPEELHIPSTGLINPNLASRQQSAHDYPTTPDAGASTQVPAINVHSSAAASMQYAPSGSAGGHSSATLPGSLTPGGQHRPPAVSVNTAPSVIPTMSQSTPQQTSHRTSMINSHGHSRSSPAGFDQSPLYKQHGVSEASKYPASPGAGFPPHTPQSSKYSPLGLADIRPPGDHILGESLMGPGSLPYNGDTQIPTNSNYVAPWPIYAVDWCKWPISGSSSSFGGKLALGSYLEDNHNYIQIIDTHWTQPDPDTPDAAAGEIKLDYVKTAEATHSYPVTRILWEPPSSQKQSTDLLATSGDHLRLWSLPNSQPLQSSNSITRPSSQRDAPPAKLSPLALLSNSKSPEHTAPITSLDWNTISPSLIITSSIDTTCTIWDIPTLTAKTQLIAHDKEVYDVRFCANSVDVFVSCGADGSVRMFDLRSLEHSTIIYEPSEKTEKPVMSPGNSSPSGPSQSGLWPPPLLRIAASPHDAHLLATFSQDSSVVRVLDVRQPGQALLELKGHSASLNCVEWSPNRRGVLASGGDDSLVLIWDLINQHNAAPLSQPQAPGTPAQATTSERGPAVAWQCDYEVSNISWSPQGGPNHSGQPREWLGVCGGRGIWGVSL